MPETGVRPIKLIFIKLLQSLKLLRRIVTIWHKVFKMKSLMTVCHFWRRWADMCRGYWSAVGRRDSKSQAPMREEIINHKPTARRGGKVGKVSSVCGGGTTAPVSTRGRCEEFWVLRPWCAVQVLPLGWVVESGWWGCESHINSSALTKKSLWEWAGNTSLLAQRQLLLKHLGGVRSFAAPDGLEAAGAEKPCFHSASWQTGYVVKISQTSQFWELLGTCRQQELKWN